jgi:hypothetical protein
MLAMITGIAYNIIAYSCIVDNLIGTVFIQSALPRYHNQSSHAYPLYYSPPFTSSYCAVQCSAALLFIALLFTALLSIALLHHSWYEYSGSFSIIVR